nr:DUF2335 domain-containing protein [uncultured Halomonas sp.]
MSKSNNTAPNDEMKEQPVHNSRNESSHAASHRAGGESSVPGKGMGPAKELDGASEEEVQELDRLNELLQKETSTLTPDEVELRDELIEKHRAHLRQGIQRVEIAQFSGPLPPPALLASYEQVLPGAAERIFQLTEREQEFRHRKDGRFQDYLKDELKESTLTQRIGQVAATIISLVALGLGFYAFSVGASGWGVAIVITEIAALAGAFVFSRKGSSNGQDISKSE